MKARIWRAVKRFFRGPEPEPVTVLDVVRLPGQLLISAITLEIFDN